MKNEDIEVRKRKFKREFCTNPVNPTYPEVKCPPLSKYQMKFLRDNLKIDDIEGSKPEKLIRDK